MQIHLDVAYPSFSHSSGIGLAAAKHFASKGMNIFMADINVPLLETSVKEVKEISGAGEVNSMVCDVADFDQVMAMKDSVLELYGDVSAGLVDEEFDSLKHVQNARSRFS